MGRNHHLGYRCLQGILNLVGRLPFGVLYGMSSGMAWAMEYAVRYRRQVVDDNLATSFPEKEKKELLGIRHKFYQNFADFVVEVLKMPHLSAEEMKQRMVFVNAEIYDQLVDEGRSTAVYLAHLFNWEWGTSITQWIGHELGTQVVFDQIYRPLRNKFFDELFLKIRGRFGAQSFKKNTVLRDLVKLRQQGIPTVSGFLSDQKPSHGDLTHVVEFLNHPTAIITGTEQLARRMKMAVVYWDMEKVSRGHYRITSHLLTRDASLSQPMSITDEYARRLEQTIRRDPSLWLWSHKRWKHKVSFEDDNTTCLGNNSQL